VVGAGETERNECVQMQERVRKELQDVLGVSKKMWSRGSRSWHAGDARGSSGGGGATWKKQGRASIGSGRRRRGRGGRVEGLRAAQGRWERCTWPTERRRQSGAKRTEEAGVGGGRRGLICDFLKV
jgi:hypothetical protein